MGPKNLRQPAGRSCHWRFYGLWSGREEVPERVVCGEESGKPDVIKAFILGTVVAFTEHLVCPGPGALCVPSRQHPAEAATTDVTSGRGAFSSIPPSFPAALPPFLPSHRSFTHLSLSSHRAIVSNYGPDGHERGPALSSLLYKDLPLGHAQGIWPQLPKDPGTHAEHLTPLPPSPKSPHRVPCRLSSLCVAVSTLAAPTLPGPTCSLAGAGTYPALHPARLASRVEGM